MQRATQLDPSCAMAWWGVTLACSPHINAPGVSPERAKLAWDALATAEKFSAPCTPAERALIRAMTVRFAADAKATRRPLDEAYANAMREVWRAHADDADIGAWFADSLMMLRPWDLWRKDGAAQPGTEEVLAVLDRLNPRQLLANHLAVHAHEASSHPERADAAADLLRELTPGLGHLVHMSSHIDVRRGRWQEAIVANTEAITADLRYRATAGRALSGYLNYMGHDYHMLCYAAMMSGQGELAARTMRDLFARMPVEWARDSTMGDGYFAMRFEVMKRFGKWDEILAEPEPIKKYFHARAWRFLSRGIALAAKGDPVGARAEEKAFVAACERIPTDAVYRKNPLEDNRGDRGAAPRRRNPHPGGQARARAGGAARRDRARGQAEVCGAARVGAARPPGAGRGVDAARALRRGRGNVSRAACACKRRTPPRPSKWRRALRKSGRTPIWC
jgi:hypothetical protein